jgi:dual specificity phosphatase 3
MENAVTKIGAANANFVTAQLAIGGDLAYDDELAARQAIDLIEHGITHVLDVRQECDDAEMWELVTGVTYKWAGIDDAGQRIQIEWFDEIVRWALESLADPNAKLLTHCHMGINRGPSAGYAEDALRWHHWATGASPEGCRHDLDRVRQWRAENPLDVVRIIRQVRESELT